MTSTISDIVADDHYTPPLSSLVLVEVWEVVGVLCFLLKLHVVHGVPQLICVLQGAIDDLLVQKLVVVVIREPSLIAGIISIWTCDRHLVCRY